MPSVGISIQRHGSCLGTNITQGSITVISRKYITIRTTRQANFSASFFLSFFFFSRVSPDSSSYPGSLARDMTSLREQTINEIQHYGKRVGSGVTATGADISPPFPFNAWLAIQQCPFRVSRNLPNTNRWRSSSEMVYERKENCKRTKDKQTKKKLTKHKRQSL